ncbi:hypothetical protein ACP70R_030452 [Stipagrostis hirtigluma subsp. patula]
MVWGGTWRQEEADGSVAAAEHLEVAFERGLLGLAAASTAMTLVVFDPPQGIDKTTYCLALSGAFFAGVNQVVASVWGPGRRRRRQSAVCASLLAPLVVAAGLTVASLLD